MPSEFKVIQHHVDRDDEQCTLSLRAGDEQTLMFTEVVKPDGSVVQNRHDVNLGKGGDIRGKTTYVKAEVGDVNPHSSFVSLLIRLTNSELSETLSEELKDDDHKAEFKIKIEHS